MGCWNLEMEKKKRPPLEIKVWTRPLSSEKEFGVWRKRTPNHHFAKINFCFSKGISPKPSKKVGFFEKVVFFVKKLVKPSDYSRETILKKFSKVCFALTAPPKSCFFSQNDTFDSDLQARIWKNIFSRFFNFKNSLFGDFFQWAILMGVLFFSELFFTKIL